MWEICTKTLLNTDALTKAIDKAVLWPISQQDDCTILGAAIALCIDYDSAGERDMC